MENWDSPYIKHYSIRTEDQEGETDICMTWWSNRKDAIEYAKEVFERNLDLKEVSVWKKGFFYKEFVR